MPDLVPAVKELIVYIYYCCTRKTEHSINTLLKQGLDNDLGAGYFHCNTLLFMETILLYLSSL